MHTARSLLKRNRHRGLSQLSALFRDGGAPDPPLDGRYAGELVALDIAPAVTQLAEAVASIWLPWKGKVFDGSHARGDNIFSRDSLRLTRVIWPRYRDLIEDGPDTYRAFRFRTSEGPSRDHPRQSVLRLDYDLTGNPGLSVRRVLDEVVQISDGLYLGKAYLKWWWGRWQLVAYFSLSSRPAVDPDPHETSG